MKKNITHGMDPYTDYDTVFYAEIIYTPEEYIIKQSINMEEHK